MKKYLLMIIAALGIFTGFAAAYQQQGFNQYTENDDGTISFWCQTSCVILLGEKDGQDTIKVEGGTRQGDGSWGYGYIVGQQVYAATVVPAGSYERSFVDDPIYSQLPAGSNQVAFLVSGPLKADNITIEMSARSFGQSISRGWQRFRKVERLAPYSINLHYGPMIGAWSWPFFGLIMSLLTLLIIYLVRKKLTVRNVFETYIAILVIVMIAGGVRLLYDHISIASRGHAEYASVTEGKKFFDLGDYISVTEKVRTALDLDNVEARRDKECKIYAKSHQSRPFDAHWSAVYLRPCEMVQTGALADYGLYYNVQSTDATGSTILSGFNFSLYNFRQ